MKRGRVGVRRSQGWAGALLSDAVQVFFFGTVVLDDNSLVETVATDDW